MGTSGSYRILVLTLRLGLFGLTFVAAVAVPFFRRFVVLVEEVDTFVLRFFVELGVAFSEATVEFVVGFLDIVAAAEEELRLERRSSNLRFRANA